MHFSRCLAGRKMKRSIDWLISNAFLPTLFLLLLTAYPLLTPSAEFTGDDYYFILQNPLVTTPGIAPLAEIWQRPMKNEYFPVTITSYALEYRLWGARANLFHLTNLLLFAFIGLFARELAIRLSELVCQGRQDREWLTPLAGMATLLMLCHPLNVESVAAISNRKELLYVLFALLSIRCYLSERKVWISTTSAIFFMVLAQLSKGSAVILPGIFLCCELMTVWLKRDRLKLHRVAAAGLLAVVIFIAQFRIALKAGVVEKNIEIDLLSRIGGVIRSFNMMIVKFLLPINLSYDYDFVWPHGLPPVKEWLLPLCVAGLLILLIVRRNWGIFLVATMLLLTLMPYANIIPLRHNSVGQMVFYDHYLLFATVISASLLTIVLLPFDRKWQLAQVVAFTVCIVPLAGYNSYLFRFWQTRESLYRRIIQIAPALPKGYLFLGETLNEKGRYNEAIDIFDRLLSLDNWFPTYLKVYRDIGDAHAFSGQLPEAVKFYRSYLQYQPKDRGVLQNLSAALIGLGQYGDAKVTIMTWLSHYPDDAEAKYNMQICERMLLAKPLP